MLWGGFADYQTLIDTELDCVGEKEERGLRGKDMTRYCGKSKHQFYKKALAYTRLHGTLRGIKYITKNLI